MESRPLEVLLVGEDRSLLRRLSQFLTVLDYQVHQVADWQHSARALAACAADFLILDAGASLDAATEVCHLAVHQADARVYTLLLLEHPTADSIQRGLVAGADDFLVKPVVYGELLARLRAGARALEFERRVAWQRGVEPTTRLPNRAALDAWLTKALSSGTAGGEPVACAVWDVDFLSHVNKLHGYDRANDVLRAVAARLGEIAGADRRIACLGGGTFAAVLPRTSEAAAAAWTDETRQLLAETDLPCGDQPIRLTASGGVSVSVAGGTSAADLLREAEEALRSAKHSGRNCVIRFAEQQELSAEWDDFTAPGKLFQRTVARDVMTPCPLTLQTADSFDFALEVVRRTQLGALPVVDASGNLVGLLVAPDGVSDTLANDKSENARVGQRMETDVATCGEDEPFATLREFFQRDPRFHMVVTAGRRPVGLVSPDRLAALGVKLTADSFANAAEPSAGTAYLVVPDLCLASDAEQDG